MKDQSSLGLTYGYTNTIKSSLIFDFSIGRHFALSNGALTSKLAIVNLFDKKTPRLFDAPDLGLIQEFMILRDDYYI